MMTAPVSTHQPAGLTAPRHTDTLSGGAHAGHRQDRPRSVAHLPPQPTVGIVTLALALLTTAATWRTTGLERVLGGSATFPLVALCLAGLTVLAYQFPLHLHRHTKVYMSSAVSFVLAVLVPPPLVIVAAGLGSLTGEWSVRARRGTTASTIATQGGRRMLVVWLGAMVAHLPTSLPLHAVALGGAALVLGAGDVLTFPLVVGPLSGERPLRVITGAARAAWGVEGAQYLCALVGVMVAQQGWTLVLLVPPTVLAYRAFKSATELQEGTRTFLEGLADAVDLRDPYTGGHSRRVTALTAGILGEVGVTGPEAALILAAARVHDIGKIGVPDAVLHKPGRLTDAERALMEEHPAHGAALLTRYGDFARGVEIVRHHHESWDGTGYPGGLAGGAIPFGARVLAIADSFDAMTSDRPYRAGMPIETACGMLRQGRGRQWDGALVDAFLRSIAPRLQQAVKARGTVLVIDDDPAIVAFLTAALHEDGYHVLATENHDALQVARTQHPDVILLDLMMPEMDGREMSRCLRADRATADIPIVAMSGHERLRASAREMAVDDQLPKPFELAQLYDTVERWMRTS